jgi:O-antigen ligase
LGLIVFSPLPAASVRKWSVLVIQLVVLVMMAAYFLKKDKPQPNSVLSHALKWPKYFFLALWILIIVQVLPLPKFLVKLFSPNALTFREAYSPGFSNIGTTSFSLIPAQSIQAALDLLPYFFLGFLIIKTVRSRSQIIQIYTVLIAMGVFEAFYGLFELTNKNPRILFFDKVFGTDVVTGTFVNRNHLSGYLEMIIPLGIGLIIARTSLFSLSEMKWKDKLMRLSEKGIAMNLLISLGVMIMALAIFFSKSRSGIFLLFFTFTLFFVLSFLHFGKFEAQKAWIRSFLLVSFLVILVISLYLGVENSLNRFGLENIRSEVRPVFWSNTLRMSWDYPVVGIGLGNFSSLYPNFMQTEKLIKISHAHNDYLEFLVELGAFGFILLSAGILMMVGYIFLYWKQRRYPLVKGLALGGFISLTCILIHSLTDFNLQIPANRLLFTVVLSLTLATVAYKVPGSRKGQTENINDD